MHICELKETLKNLVKFLATGHRAAYRLLKPKALLCVYQQNYKYDKDYTI